MKAAKDAGDNDGKNNNDKNANKSQD